MPLPVRLVTIHHEGAGDPPNLPRGASGGYTYWIGVTDWTWLRSVWDSYATKDFNHVSLDICLSGNRQFRDRDHPGFLVSDADIHLIEGAVRDARQRGYVVDVPQVRAHRFSPGSTTVCPGTHTLDRWPAVEAACMKVETLMATAAAVQPNGTGYYVFSSTGKVYAYGCEYYGGIVDAPTPNPRDKVVKLAAPIVDAAVTPDGHGYWMLGGDGGVF